MKASAKWPSLPLPEAFWFQEGPGVRNWQFTTSGIKLLNVANIEKDGTLNLRKTERYLKESEVAKKYSHFLVDADDLVIASSGISFDDDGLLRTRGAFVREEHLPLCLNTSTIRFKAIDGVSDLRFLRLWLNSREFRSQITKLVTGTAQQNFGPSHLKATRIALPSLAEQQWIAEVLDRAEALRVKRRTALAELESLTHSIFLDLFGDPLTNPKGWRKIKLGEMVKRITKGESPKWQGFEYQDNGALFVTSENVRLGAIDLSVPKFIPLEFNRKLSRSELKPGDLLVNLVGASIGRSCVFPGYHAPANINQAVAVVTINPSRLDGAFLAGLLASERGQSLLLNNRVEGARANISLTDLRELDLPVPPIQLQREFARRVRAVENLKTTQRASLAEMDALFATLQHRAFRGEL